MALIRIKSVGSEVKVEVDGFDLTPHILADPRPVVSVASAVEAGDSRVTLTLVGDLDLEVDGVVQAS